MTIKLWIIYKNDIGFPRMIAEMLQDRLEDYIDVDVGTAKKLDPTFILEEKIDYLIIGDVICKDIPSIEIKDWLLKYWEISENKKKKNLKAVSGFYIAQANIKIEPFWVEFLNDNIRADLIYPPILRLKLNENGLELENRAVDLIKEFSNDFIEFLINNKKKKIRK